jgi:integrase
MARTSKPGPKARNPRNSWGPRHDEKRGRWVQRYKMPDGSIRYLIAKTASGCAEKRDQLVRDLAAGELPSSASTFGTWAAVWVRDILPNEGRAGSTVIGYRYCAARLVDELGAIRLDALSAEHVERAYRNLSTRAHHPLGLSMLGNIRVVLGLMLGEAEQRGHVRRNVAKIAKLPKSTARPSRVPRALEVDEVGRFLAAAAHTLYGHLFAVMALTGARRGELLGLSWSAVDLDAATLTIREGLRLDAAGRWEIGRTKTANSVRVIGLSPAAVEHFRAREIEQDAEQFAASYWSNPAGLVFTTETGRHLPVARVRREFAKVASAADLVGITPHDLRHTAGSQAVEHGVPLADVADYLGHDLATLADRYRHRVGGVVSGVGSVMGEIADAGSSL